MMINYYVKQISGNKEIAGIGIGAPNASKNGTIETPKS